ncbi:MAG: DUF2203 domain-containing protein [Thermoplasmata archaeon]|nr:DUF2203 domain-containing protein [Thermoplasmata archaeon]
MSSEKMGDPTDDAPTPEPARFWTVAEANERLEGLRGTLARVRASAVRLQAVSAECERLTAFWGGEVRAPDHPDRGLLDRLDRETEALRSKLEKEVHSLHEEGIEIKDLDAGLVDFYAVVDQEVVFLCWRRGEPEVAFFHRLDGGFRTRRSLAPHRVGTTPDARRTPR